MSLWEWRVGRTLMATRGGWIEVGITHAKVIMFAFPDLLRQVTSTVCIGCRIRRALERLTSVFFIESGSPSGL